MIIYRIGNDLDVDAVIELYRTSTLGEHRPVDDCKRMALMLRNANLDRLAAVAAIHDVINRAGILDSQLAGNAGRVARAASCSCFNIKTPFNIRHDCLKMWSIIIRVVVDYTTMIFRHLTEHLLQALADTPVVLVNGARQTGKSTLVQSAPLTRPGRQYFSGIHAFAFTRWVKGRRQSKTLCDHRGR